MPCKNAPSEQSMLTLLETRGGGVIIAGYSHSKTGIPAQQLFFTVKANNVQ